MFKLEFKEPAAVLLVLAAAALGLGLLGTNPMAPSGPALSLWIRIAFGAFGVAALVVAVLLSRTKLSQETQPSVPKQQIPAPAGDPLLMSPTQTSRSLANYNLTFSDECRSDLRQLALDEADVVLLVQQEFTNHVNYFLYDLEDYVLPVRTGFLIFLDKVNSKICFRAVRRSTISEVKLHSWNDILALYRRAGRLAYREPANAPLVITNKAMLPTARRLHLEAATRIRNHFLEYEDILVNSARPKLRQAPNIGEIVGRSTDLTLMVREISLHLSSSNKALDDAQKAVYDLENSLISADRAIQDIVTSLELSLQHIHKILIRFPPTG